MTVVVVVVLLWKVIPVFENMFKDFGGGALPKPTQIVISISNAFVDHALLIMGSLFGSVVGFLWGIRTKKGRAIFDKFILKVPVIGNVLRKVAVARFSRTMGTLLSSGVAILDAALPKIDGFNILLELRSKNSDAAVFISSGRGDEERQAKALELGADDFITKPIDAPRLLAVAARFTERENPPA